VPITDGDEGTPCFSLLACTQECIEKALSDCIVLAVFLPQALTITEGMGVRGEKSGTWVHMAKEGPEKLYPAPVAILLLVFPVTSRVEHHSSCCHCTYVLLTTGLPTFCLTSTAIWNGYKPHRGGAVVPTIASPHAVSEPVLLNGQRTLTLEGPLYYRCHQSWH
jgi:hypothetical protein